MHFCKSIKIALLAKGVEKHLIICMRRPRPIEILLAGGVFGAFC